MSYRCIHLLESQYLKRAKLLAGEKKLYNAIRWSHVAELSKNPGDVIPCLRSGDCLIILGEILKENPEEKLLFLMNKAIGLNLSAVIIYQSDYLPHVPINVINAAKEGELPLIYLDSEQPAITDLVSEISYRIVNNDDRRIKGQHILFDIMTNDIRDKNAFIASARFHKFELSLPHQAIVISLSITKHQTDTSEWVKRSSQVVDFIESICKKTLNRYFEKALMASLLDSFLILIPKNQFDLPINKIANMILNELQEYKDKSSFNIGIGNIYEDLNDFHQSIDEAKQVANVAYKLGISNRVIEVKDMLIPLFIVSQINNPLLNELIELNIKPLLEIDRTEKTNLFETLSVYLECDKNISIAAEKLFIHRNTMSSRLQKIEQIINKNFLDINDCFELQLLTIFYKLAFSDRQTI
ncbi:helix-turn-helix domain-containing protein [Paenibacillus sp. J22TS3]|uniref:helix-turn-helix domain-containing protein n=1 Tax=Paenibacillus sp. J22TS3 TaxID=2807192 RepID=UPI001B0392A0|nr:helix-turn-helix domain-containing protein [Paenibacillus sp. J22TS3]GIP22744.1 transcriptional regulator [Paenibacillus sp. J22TS3]